MTHPSADLAPADAHDGAMTVVLPRVEPDAEDADLQTAWIDLAGDPPGAPPTTPPAAPSTAPAAGRGRRAGLILAAVLGVVALLYLGDLLFGRGSIPRGVTVAGVQVGGLSPQDAEERLRAEIQPRTTGPIAVEAAEVRTTLDPQAAGLQLDWAATVGHAAEQPVNPWTRLMSLFTDREVGTVSFVDQTKLTATIEALAPTVDKAPVEGNIRFDGLTPAPVDPVPGRNLDRSAAADALIRDWAFGRSVALALITIAPTAGADAVQAALEQVARPAVSAPVILLGEGKQATVTPEVIATALHFTPDGTGGLKPEVEAAKIIEAVTPALASTEQPGRDASLTVQGGTPVVTPSSDGRGIDYPATLATLPDVLKRAGNRQLTAIYAAQPAKLTTQRLTELGITTVIGEFTTRGFAGDSGRNIKRAAEQINGKILLPGETFSLNDATGKRDAAQGYVEAGIIEDGHPARGIGGGVSQLATTTYNAAYFAGMTDVAHREHSFYISRYPAAREATVFEGAIDLRFRNDNPTGVLVQTVWTPSSITVRLFGTKRYEVSSATSPRINPTTPNEVVLPAGPTCHPSNGSGGFTATDTRTLREISTGKVRQETHTVTYKPSPKIVCGEPPPALPPG